MTHAGLTRRDVIVAGGAACVAAVAGPFARAAIAAPSPLRRTTYIALSDRTFRIRRGATARTITLRDIADLPRAAALAKYRSSEHAFSLLFEGAAGGDQGTYTFEHPVIGRFQMFLTPIGPRSHAQIYEAVVDRLYRPTARHPAPT
jgi:hypothetical protein